MADIKDPENTIIIELKDGPVDVTIVFPGAIATDIAGNSGVTVNAPADDTAAAEASSHPMTSAVDAAEANPDVHAVIVTGAGKAFCAGADLTALGAATEDGLRVIYDGFLAVAECSLPTIAAVNGPAVGAGLNLALAADAERHRGRHPPPAEPRDAGRAVPGHLQLPREPLDDQHQRPSRLPGGVPRDRLPGPS